MCSFNVMAWFMDSLLLEKGRLIILVRNEVRSFITCCSKKIVDSYYIFVILLSDSSPSTHLL